MHKSIARSHLTALARLKFKPVARTRLQCAVLKQINFIFGGLLRESALQNLTPSDIIAFNDKRPNHQNHAYFCRYAFKDRRHKGNALQDSIHAVFE